MIREMLTKRRELRPQAVFRAGGVALLLVVLLWLAGFDRGAMMMLIASLLFYLAVYGAYLSDPLGGRVSARRGALVGGLTALVWMPGVACQSSYQLTGSPFPNSLGEALGLVLTLVFFVIPFGASFGMMTGIIGGRVRRATSGFARAGRGKRKPRQSDAAPFDELFG